MEFETDSSHALSDLGSDTTVETGNAVLLDDLAKSVDGRGVGLAFGSSRLHASLDSEIFVVVVGSND